jgi:hypothetical protein
MALRRNVLQENDILCELYADRLSEVSDNSGNESLDSDSDSDVPTTSLCKQLLSFAVVVTSDSETSTKERANSEPESSDDKPSDMWPKTDKQSNIELFLRTKVLNTVTDNPEYVVEVVRSITGDDLQRRP